MEYCEGGDLYSLISRHGSGRSGGLLPESLILFYFVQLCRALAHIHERKILHRDVKSRNVFLCSRLRVKGEKIAHDVSATDLTIFRYRGSSWETLG